MAMALKELFINADYIMLYNLTDSTLNKFVFYVEDMFKMFLSALDYCLTVMFIIHFYELV